MINLPPSQLSIFGGPWIRTFEINASHRNEWKQITEAYYWWFITRVNHTLNLKEHKILFLFLVLVKLDPLITNILLLLIQTVLFLSYFTGNIQYRRQIDFQKKLSFGSRDLCDVRCRVESKQQIYFIRRIWRFRTSSEEFGA